MRGLRHYVGPVVAALLAALGMAVAIAVRPGDADAAVEAYVLFLGAIGMALLTQATSRTFAPPAASRLAVALHRPPRSVQRLPELERIERELEMATQSAYDTYFRLRPILRELASTRLATRGVRLDETAGRAQQLLGPDAWPLVRPGLERPANHYEPGIGLDDVEGFVQALERMP